MCSALHMLKYSEASFTAPWIVMTAAHCLKSKDIKVYAGLVDIRDNSTEIQIIDVEEAKAHPDYINSFNKSTSHIHDIALLLLQRPFLFNGSLLLYPFALVNTVPSLLWSDLLSAIQRIVFGVKYVQPQILTS